MATRWWAYTLLVCTDSLQTAFSEVFNVPLLDGTITTAAVESVLDDDHGPHCALVTSI